MTLRFSEAVHSWQGVVDLSLSRARMGSVEGTEIGGAFGLTGRGCPARLGDPRRRR